MDLNEKKWKLILVTRPFLFFTHLQITFIYTRFPKALKMIFTNLQKNRNWSPQCQHD